MPSQTDVRSVVPDLMNTKTMLSEETMTDVVSPLADSLLRWSDCRRLIGKLFLLRRLLAKWIPMVDGTSATHDQATEFTQLYADYLVGLHAVLLQQDEGEVYLCVSVERMVLYCLENALVCLVAYG